MQLQKVLEKKPGEQQEEFRKQLSKKDKQINELQHYQNALRIKVGILPYDIIFHKFMERKRRNGEIKSPKMYMGDNKFEILLLPNGIKGGSGTHVAVNTCCNQGDKLKFPASFTITLELLNQHRDQDHYRKDIKCEVTKEKLVSERDKYKCRFYYINMVYNRRPIYN